MEKTAKTTYKQAIEYAIQNLPDAPENITEKLRALVDSLEKKAENRKPTAQQTENAECGESIYAYLSELDPEDRKTVADIIKECPAVAGFSSSRVTSIMNKLGDAHRVLRVSDKRRNYYKAVRGE